ncbi:TerB family tellurite resistance protein, partial [Streptomyces goshikiensis]
RGASPPCSVAPRFLRGAHPPPAAPRLGLYDGPECCGAALSIELHEALEPLAPHLAGPGRESILLQGARIALADGPYIPAEREVLATVGAALRMTPDEVARLPSAVRATGA